MTVAAACVGLALAGCGNDEKRPTNSGDSRTDPPTAGRYVDAPDGSIAFMRPGEIGEFDIWSVQPNGSGLRRLTQSPSNRSDYNPDWSPDGSSVLFERRNLEEGGDDLHIVQADGTGLRQVIDCSGDCWSDNEARWSPDGKRIAFGRASGPRSVGHPTKIAIHVGSANGRDIRQVSRPPKGYEDHYPTWSPDGRTIVFQRDRSTEMPRAGKFIAVNVRTGAERVVYRLPRWAPGSGIPAFSPDGKWILFGFFCVAGDDACPLDSRSPRNAKLATIRPDGSGLRRLKLGVDADSEPWAVHADSGAWAPDGTRLAFRCQALDRTGLPLFRLCTARLDGGELKRFPWVLTSAHPDWGPPS
jgi:Tol biopolymer transport system component